jgi:hypothetical protein
MVLIRQPYKRRGIFGIHFLRPAAPRVAGKEGKGIGSYVERFLTHVHVTARSGQMTAYMKHKKYSFL